MQQGAGRPVDPQSRYRTLMIIWGAIFMNVVFLFVLANFIGPEQSRLPENSVLDFTLGAVAACVTILSVFFRRRMTQRALEQRRPQSVSGAYIVAFAMCELAALLGLMIRFTTNETKYYLLFILAIVGLLLNMPQRDDVTQSSGQN
jgi:Na+/glutamate symporter